MVCGLWSSKKMPNDRNNPIGVFDSGLGGLTVVKELMHQLPSEDVVYFGDTARVPYGTKSRESIVRFSRENVSLLLKRKVKMVVVACNTSSSVALPVLRDSFPVPVVGVIAPGVRKAVEVTRTKRVGIIATSATIHSQEYTREIRRLSPSLKVITQACGLFVPLVEEGWFKNATTTMIAEQYLSKMKKAKVDTLILGCTHYPLLKSVIKKVMGDGVVLIDSAKEVAREVKQLLEYTQKNSLSKRKGQAVFLVSDEPQHFQGLAKRFLGFSIEDVERCSDV